MWGNQRKGFGFISSRDQRYLHEFFRPSETLTEAELIAHRKAISSQHPSLPHQAGWALKHFANPAALKQPPADGKRRIVIHAILRPEPDIKRLTQAFLCLARQLADEEAQQCDAG